MLLLPLLIWAATLFGCVQPYTKHECGTKYACLAPRECLGQGDDEYEKRRIKIVANDETIAVGCNLLLRFHRYDKKKMRVILETEDSSKTYQSIEVEVTTRDDKPAQESLFSCLLVEGTAVGRIGNSKTNAKPLGGKNKKEPLRCEFDVMRTDGEAVWVIDDNDQFAAVLKEGINSTSFPMNSEVHQIGTYCDPDRLTPPKPLDPENRPTERYAPIEYDMGTFVCPFPAVYSKMEYRTNAGYKPVSSIKCTKGKITIAPVDIKPGENTEVRCVADTDYFCDYDVKAPTKLDERTQKKLNVTKGDSTKKVPRRGRIECPANYPYFVMGSRAPVIDYNLTCRTKLTKQLWHYGETAITKDGPIVYCTNALTCPKLAPTSFDGSYLDKDNQPTCQKDGTLQLKKGGSTIMDPFEGRVGCNEKTGWMGYLSKGQWQRITDEVFYCQYIDHAEQLDEKARKTVNWSIYGSTIGSCVLSLGCLILYSVRRWRDDRKHRFDAAQQQHADSLRAKELHNKFGMKGNEKRNEKGRQFEAVRSVRSLCGKKMPLRLTNEPDPEPTTLKTTNTAWSLPAFAITTPELLTESPLSARPIEDALFEKVFAKMDENFKATMALLPQMFSDAHLGKAHNLTVNKVSRAEALFYKMKAEDRVTGEYVPVTTHESLANEARTALIAAACKKSKPAVAKKPQPQPKSEGKESDQPPAAK